MTDVELHLRGVRRGVIEMVFRRFSEMGLEIIDQHDGLTVYSDGRLRSIDVATLPTKIFPRENARPGTGAQP